MASKTNAAPQKEEVPKKEGPETSPDSPLLDVSDAAVKKLIRSAKKRGYVSHDQINALLSSDGVKSEQIEDILAMFSGMGVNVVETEEAEPEDEGARVEPDDDEEESEGELVEVKPKLPAKTEAKGPSERTDDPVRMYMREMGTVELLSREGGIAIAKRIEAGRDAMIAGLCESPLTFQAIIIWRDELLLKRWLLGTHQGAVSATHLDYYLDEYTFRFNRRTSGSRGLLFLRLIQQAVDLSPVPAKELLGGRRLRKNATN